MVGQAVGEAKGADFTVETLERIQKTRRTRTTLQLTPRGKQNLPLSSAQPVRAVSHHNREQRKPHQVRTGWASLIYSLPESHRDHVLPGRAVAWPRGAAARGYHGAVSVPTAGVLRSEGTNSLSAWSVSSPQKGRFRLRSPLGGRRAWAALENPEW